MRKITYFNEREYNLDETEMLRESENSDYNVFVSHDAWMAARGLTSYDVRELVN